MFTLLVPPLRRGGGPWAPGLEASKNMYTGIRNLLLDLVRITILCWWWFLQQITRLFFPTIYSGNGVVDNTYISECLKNHCNRWFIHFSWRGLLNSTWFSSSMSMFKMASLLGRDNIFRRLFLYAMHFSWDRRTALIVLCSSLGFFFQLSFPCRI